MKECKGILVLALVRADISAKQIDGVRLELCNSHSRILHSFWHPLLFCPPFAGRKTLLGPFARDELF